MRAHVPHRVQRSLSPSPEAEASYRYAPRLTRTRATADTGLNATLRCVRLLSTQSSVCLVPDPGHEGLVSKRGLDVPHDPSFEEVGPDVVLVAVLDVPALAADVVGVPPFLLVGADAHHVALAPCALDGSGEQTLIAVVESASVQILYAILPDLPSLFEEDRRDDGVVVPVIDHSSPTELPNV